MKYFHINLKFFLLMLNNYIKRFIYEIFFFLFSGIFAGLYLSWPGLLISKNWKCFYEIIERSAEDKISIKATLEVSPSYLIKGKNKNMTSKIRVVADACFR